MNETNEGRERLLLVDGMALLFRAYFATSFTGSIRRTSTGVPVNGVHGFVRYFMDAVKRFGLRILYAVGIWGARPSGRSNFQIIKEIVRMRRTI